LLTVSQSAGSESLKRRLRGSGKSCKQLDLAQTSHLMPRKSSMAHNERSALQTRPRLPVSSFHTSFQERTTILMQTNALVDAQTLAPTRASKTYGPKNCAEQMTVAINSNLKLSSTSESTRTWRMIFSCSMRRLAYATRRSTGSRLSLQAPQASPPLSRTSTRSKRKRKLQARSARLISSIDRIRSYSQR
jgi:hypothetical protein